MPLAFPSHQGLILPIVRLCPRAFDVAALCVGAAMPDVVDGVIGFARHGHLGQGIGHSLAGVGLLCWPGGLLLTWALTAADRRMDRAAALAGPRRWLGRAAGWAG